LEKQKTTNKLLNHFPVSALWIRRAPLTWQEQENLGLETHFGALPAGLSFLRLYRLVVGS
jgi:hypothetical protein